MRLLAPDFPFRPDRLPVFYGWVVLGACTLGIVMSIPGQTMGVSTFTDHLIAATGLSRLQLSNAYLVGTILSGLLLPKGGRLLDRFGARATVLGSSLLLAGTLLYLARVDRIAAAIQAEPGIALSSGLLVLGFLTLRFGGQGMLTLVSRTTIGRWFDRKRGKASAISGLFVAFGFAGAPLLFSAWIAHSGWRGAWTGMALLVAVGMGGLGWLLYRDDPESCGLLMDGSPPPQSETDAAAAPASQREVDRAEALRTLAFWVLTGALAGHGLVVTGITFHIVSLGAEAGLSEPQSVAIFLPMAVVSVVVGYLSGLAADRWPLRRLLLIMVACQATGYAGAAHLDGIGLWICTAGLGAAGGFFATMSTVALPRWFGRRHLGAIAGFQMMCMVIGSALGPSFLALSQQWLGSYAPGLHASCLLPGLVFVAGLVMREPEG